MEKKYQQVLFQQANLQKIFYNYPSDIQPCSYFLKQLVKGKQTPSILIPDTLLINDKQNPLIWIYTNQKGKLQKSTNINFKDFINKITNYCSPNELSATLKRVTYNDNYINGNDVKLLNARYLLNASLQQIGAQSQTMITLQRYIKSNGNKAFICRTIFRKNKNSQCYIITNKKSFYDNNQPQNKRFLVKVSPSSDHNQQRSCTIIKSQSGRHLTQTSNYLKNIVDFMKLYRGILLNQIVGDFIKDQSGNWWLLNIKAFQIQHKLNINTSLLSKSKINLINQQQSNSNNIDKQRSFDQKYEKQKYQKTKICRYCQKTYLQSQLNHVMTIKMLIQTDRYLLHLGKNYKWLRRSDIQNVDSHCLYQQHKICQRCYRLYTEIQQLIDVQNNFLKKLGFQIDKTPKQLLMSLTNQQQLKNQSKNKQIQQLANLMRNPISSNYYNENQQIQLNQSNQHHQQSNTLNLSINKQNGSYPIHSFPKTIQLGPNSNIIFENDCPVKNDQMINKMIRYRMILYLRQIDQIQIPNHLNNGDYNGYSFFLEYQLFGIKNKIKLDFATNYNSQKKVLNIKKLKINYFFSHSHKDVYTYLKQQSTDFVINIIVQEKINNTKSSFLRKANSKKNTMNADEQQLNYSKIKENQKTKENQKNKEKENQKIKQKQKQKQKQKRTIIGKLCLPFKEMFNNILNPSPNKITKKDFYKFFSVDTVSHGWGLQGSVGIIPSQSYVNTARMIFFTQDHLIFLPSKDYYYCEHLPEEWIDLIKKDLPIGYRDSVNQYQCKSKNYIFNGQASFYNQQKDHQQILLGKSRQTEFNRNKNQKHSIFKKKSKFYKNQQSQQNEQRKSNQKQIKYFHKKSQQSQFRLSSGCQSQSQKRINDNLKNNTIQQNDVHWKKSLLLNEIKNYENKNKISNIHKNSVNKTYNSLNSKNNMKIFSKSSKNLQTLKSLYQK